MRGEPIIDVIPAGAGPDAGPDPDTESAFNEFAESLAAQEAQGTIRCHRLEMGPDGRPKTSTQQIYLMACPIDQYKFDELIARLRDGFMFPEEKVMAVRIAGYKAGQRGILFNRIVTIQRDTVTPEEKKAGGQESVATLLRAVQEMNAENQRMIAGMLQQSRSNVPAAQDPTQTLIALLGALAPILGNRPAPAPAESLADQIKALAALKALAGDLAGNGGGNSDDNSTAEIIKAVTPLALPVLRGLQNNPAPRRAIHALPAPAQTQPMRPEPPGAAVEAARAAVQSAPAQPAARPQSTTANLTPKGDADMLAQLRTQLGAVIQMAKDGADPKESADVILGLIPQEQDEALYNLLADANWFSKLSVLNPGVNEIREWMTQVRDFMLAEFEADPADGKAEA